MRALLLPLLLTATVAAKQPNVLFILCDDLRPAALGCYGSTVVKTPHIDQLAKEGLRFANAFCTTSLCSPSRASILSGLYAHVHGVTNNFTEYPETMASFPKVLQSAGYDSAYIGKYHMGEENDSPRPGFDHFITHKGQGSYFDTTFRENGGEPKVVKGYYTTVVTDMAIDWLKRDRNGKPWTLMLGHKAPHSFYTPEEKYAHTFDDVRVPYPATANMLADKPTWIKDRLPTWHGIYGPLFDWRKQFPNDKPEAVIDFERMVHGYWGTILSVDDSVARLRTFLQESGQLDDTIIVFMGDNGLLEGEHGMVDKRTAHEPSIRIPIIVRYPGLTKEPKVIKELALTVDMAPSLLDLCGAPALTDIHGKSWVKLARDGTDPAWRTAFLYHYNYEKQFPYTPNVRAVRTQEWKLIHYPHGDGKPDRHKAELYNLFKDPDETKNVISDPRNVAVVAGMKLELIKQLRAVGLNTKTDKMPIDEGIKQGLPDQKIR